MIGLVNSQNEVPPIHSCCSGTAPLFTIHPPISRKVANDQFRGISGGRSLCLEYPSDGTPPGGRLSGGLWWEDPLKAGPSGERYPGGKSCSRSHFEWRRLLGPLCWKPFCLEVPCTWGTPLCSLVGMVQYLVASGGCGILLGVHYQHGTASCAKCRVRCLVRCSLVNMVQYLVSSDGCDAFSCVRWIVRYNIWCPVLNMISCQVFSDEYVTCSAV